MTKNKDKKTNFIKTNRIYKIDCLEGLKMMPDNCIDLIVSDPPYDIQTKRESTGIAKDCTYIKDIEYMCNGFDIRILDECVRVMKKINAFFFCSKDQIPMYIEYFSNKNVELSLLTWSKLDPPPFCCEKYLSDTEFIVYVCEKSICEKYNLLTDHFITKKVRCNKQDPLYHPTKKPVNILKTLINSASSEGDIVLDMFSGAGSTAVACIETNRKFVGFELVEKYFDVGNIRIKDAIKENPKYDSASEPLTAEKNIIYVSDIDKIQKGDIGMAYFDICDKWLNIPFDFIEKVISKQNKPNLYIMMNMVQFPSVLLYFTRQKYKFEIITSHQKNTTKFLLFLRKGGVKLYGTYHTKRKFFEDDRDMTLPNQDNIPYELMRRIVINSSLEGDTIFCKGGFGTSVEVCMKENRHFIAYENNKGKLLCCTDKTELLIQEPTQVA